MGRHQFEIYDPAYEAHREQYGERLKAMSKAIAEAQANGRDLHCTQQMYLEAKWLYRYTAHWDRLADKLTRIEQSLDEPDHSFAAEQSPVDGQPLDPHHGDLTTARPARHTDRLLSWTELSQENGLFEFSGPISSRWAQQPSPPRTRW